MAKQLNFDVFLFSAVILLALIGTVMVCSAEAARIIDHGGSTTLVALKQTFLFLLGAGAMLLAMHSFPYQKLGSPAAGWIALALTGILLVIVLFMEPVAGVRRWILFRLPIIGVVSFQPSELAKLALVLFLAYRLSTAEHRPGERLQTLFVPIGVIGGLALLVEMGQDLGTAAMIAAAGLSLLFLAGTRGKHLSRLAGLAFLMAASLVLLHPYRLERILSFLWPEKDPQGASFQLSQSLLAVATGGTIGLGLGQGQQKLHFLPQPSSDFIFGVIGEETGLLGSLLILLLYGVILWRGLRAARRAPDEFGRLLAAGLTLLVVLQGLLNISVATGVVPTTGVPLPLVSSGGTSLIVTLAAMGLLLNVSQYAR